MTNYAKLISKLHSLGQEFYFADTPVTVVKLYSFYACDFYGSQLGDFNIFICCSTKDI